MFKHADAVYSVATKTLKISQLYSKETQDVKCVGFEDLIMYICDHSVTLLYHDVIAAISMV